VFPEVRLKPHIEFRSADSVGSRFVCALPALLKGLLYDDDAAGEAWEAVAGLDFDDRMQRWHDATRRGLHDPEIHRLARRLVALSRAALDRMDVRDRQGRTEARFLDRIESLVEQGRSPADVALEALGDRPGRDAAGQHALVQHYLFAGVFG
jgi:glutamate--cysteine ligase